ncbi:DNA mismatch repair protein MutT [Aliidongia dinghuensis]|uniref:DNA mismatch repair protein MutT n=1 Tax=Aliidongia dinghuensis TaxID=1867774 RepID=A0A8J2YPG6_9PROT|nr:NUDIX domain-containing protein [Aliidongia dinghuensis]GGE99629.1 DNA mismatch repair protein MutT [Aliidongia dinghuensis]
MNPEPRVGCGAAIVVDRRILLIRRRHPPEPGHWGLPGGKVDWLEPAATAVAREVREELGLGIRPERLLCLTDQIDAAAGTHWLAPVYLVDRFEGEPRLMEPEKHDAFDWFPLDALPEPLTLATRVALPALMAALD